MKQIAILFFTVFMVHSIVAQDIKPYNCDRQLNFETKLTGCVFVLPQNIDFKTFINIHPITSDIYLIQNKKVTNINILYNSYMDEVIMQEPIHLEYIQLDKDLITGFRFYKYDNDTNVLFEKIKIKKAVFLDSTEVFAQLLLRDKVSLYAYHTVSVKEVQHIQSETSLLDKVIFKSKTVYYFKLHDNKTIGFEKLRKKHLYSLFPDKKDEIDLKLKEYSQRHFHLENDLIQITKIINQLL